LHLAGRGPAPGYFEIDDALPARDDDDDAVGWVPRGTP
jgi:hypothetical protein